MAVYWRVKKWRVEWGATWAESDQGPSDEFVTIDSGNLEVAVAQTDYGDPSFPGGEALTSEWQLICPRAGDFFTCGVEYSSGPLPPEGGFFRLSCGVEEYLGTPAASLAAFDAQAGTYLSCVRFVASTNYWGPIAAAPFDGALGQYGFFTLSVFGVDFGAPIYASNTSSADPNFSNLLSVDVALRAIEYWPYDPGDGEGPIYSTTTGQRLRANPL
jgi:hypothetical protein